MIMATLACPPEFTAEDDGYSGISGETLQKAMDELKEDPTTRATMVRDLRDRILVKETELKIKGDEESVIFERKDGKFLLRFLRARKFNLDRSLQLYTNYYKYKHKFRHLLTDFHPKQVTNVLNAGIFGVSGIMKNRSRVLYVIPSHWNFLQIPSNDPYKTFLMILERLLEDEEVQVHGISIIDNMEGMSWHLAYAFFRCEQFQKGALIELQDSFPIRFKGFHMLNQPWYLNMIMKVVKPFLTQKHRDRLQAHGDNYSALQQYIDKSHLPANFGGEGRCLDDYNLKGFFEADLFDYQSVSSQSLSINSSIE